VTHDDGEELTLRRITIQLYEATRDGETELHLLTNLPREDADALTVANLYSDRWQIESVFQELTVDLCCEVSTLGYPKAALFAFSVAVLCYNAFSVTKAALRTRACDPTATATTTRERCAATTATRLPVKPTPAEEKLSTYYLADEVAGTWRGMMVVLPEAFWAEKFADMTALELANVLKDLAGQAKPDQYRQRPPSRTKSQRNRPCQPGSHCSTARVLKNGHHKQKC
jgi:hypothetical protein